MTVEGVKYRINWSAYTRGKSVFIPCLDCAAARATIQKVFSRKRIKGLFKTTIEDGIQGLRIWRI